MLTKYIYINFPVPYISVGTRLEIISFTMVKCADIFFLFHYWQIFLDSEWILFECYVIKRSRNEIETLSKSCENCSFHIALPKSTCSQTLLFQVSFSHLEI